MKEKIVEIMREKLSLTFDRIDDNKIKNLKVYGDTAAEEITAHVMEFIGWYGQLVAELHGQYGTIDLPNIPVIKNLEELYQYWLANIKNK